MSGFQIVSRSHSTPDHLDRHGGDGQVCAGRVNSVSCFNFECCKPWNKDDSMLVHIKFWFIHVYSKTYVWFKVSMQSFFDFTLLSFYSEFKNEYLYMKL